MREAKVLFPSPLAPVRARTLPRASFKSTPWSTAWCFARAISSGNGQTASSEPNTKMAQDRQVVHVERKQAHTCALATSASPSISPGTTLNPTRTSRETRPLLHVEETYGNTQPSVLNTTVRTKAPNPRRASRPGLYIGGARFQSVSYTHLTLPTILRV